MRHGRLIGAAVAGGVAVAAAPYAFNQLQRIVAQNSGTSSLANVSSVANMGEAAASGGSGAASRKGRYGYRWASSEELLGLDAAFVISKLGPARETYQESLTFKVDGCDVSYGLAGGKIASITLAISHLCEPVVDKQRIVSGTTFRQIHDFNLASVKADCLQSCGNAADPTLEYGSPGYHANNWVGYYYSALNDGDADATWIDAIRVAHGHAPDDETNDNPDWYSDVNNPPVSTRRAIGHAKINQVTIKNDIG